MVHTKFHENDSTVKFRTTRSKYQTQDGYSPSNDLLLVQRYAQEGRMRQQLNRSSLSSYACLCTTLPWASSKLTYANEDKQALLARKSTSSSQRLKLRSAGVSNVSLAHVFGNWRCLVHDPRSCGRMVKVFWPLQFGEDYRGKQYKGIINEALGWWKCC